MTAPSLRLEWLAATGIAPGEIVVASGFEHPSRGVVRCLAAPLVGAELARHGYTTARTAEVVVPATGSGDAVLVAATFLDRPRQPGGFGVAAAGPGALDICLCAVTAWAGAVRERRLLLAGNEPDWRDTRPAALLLAGNEPDGRDTRPAAALLAAEPAGQRTYAIGGLVVLIDGTGGAAPAVPPGAAPAVAPGAALAVPPGAALAQRVPRSRGHAACPEHDDRAAMVRRIAAASDVVLVPGDPADAGTRQTLAEAARYCAVVQRAGAVTDLTPESLAGADTVGVIPARSAPAALVAGLREALAGLGPLTGSVRRTGTEPLVPA